VEDSAGWKEDIEDWSLPSLVRREGEGGGVGRQEEKRELSRLRVEREWIIFCFGALLCVCVCRTVG
jgi:hypothetical protein